MSPSLTQLMTLPPLRQRISAEFDRRIAAALETKAGSMTREAVYLQNLAFQGVELTPAQQADVVMLNAINGWETAMVVVREALIAADDATFGDDGHWPPAPAGLPQFLTGY